MWYYQISNLKVKSVLSRNYLKMGGIYKFKCQPIVCHPSGHDIYYNEIKNDWTP